MGFKFFSDRELMCKCGCRRTNPNPEFKEFMDRVDRLRETYGKPLIVSSAYRCPNHPIEARKAKPGTGQHSIAAIDLRVSGADAHKLLKIAMSMNFGGVGISQKGAHGIRFIHLDDRDNKTIWSY